MHLFSCSSLARLYDGSQFGHSFLVKDILQTAHLTGFAFLYFAATVRHKMQFLRFKVRYLATVYTRIVKKNQLLNTDIIIATRNTIQKIVGSPIKR